MSTSLRLVSLAVLPLLLVCRPVAGQANLATNPGFDTGVAGWTGMNLTWDSAVDANGNPSSGSARAGSTFHLPPSLTGSSIRQCLGPIQGGGLYQFGGKVYVAPGQPVSPVSLGVRVVWYSGPDCTGFLTYVLSPLSHAIGTWEEVDSAPTWAPANALSVSLEGISETPSPVSLYANFDDLYFSAAGEAAVPVLGLPGVFLLMALLALAGITILRPRLAAPCATLAGHAIC